MKVRKAVITAAGRGQRALPLQTIVDRDGSQKSSLRVILDEALSTGVEEVCVVVNPGDQTAYREAAGDAAGRLHFAEQPVARGYGHALYCAKRFVGGDSFLHLVSDHLYISRTKHRCAQQLVQAAEANDCAVSGVQPTRESVLTYYGTVGGRRVQGAGDLYEVENVIEKPTPTEAEQTLIVPGLRAGHYLCFFGMHVLTPSVMELLEELVKDERHPGPLQLSPALAKLSRRERYLALEVQGLRYNIGLKYGLLFAQLALALDGQDREEILAQMVELLAARGRAAGGDVAVRTNGSIDAGELTAIITSEDPAVRDRSLDAFCREASLSRLMSECDELDAFRRRSDNLYQRVRALFFLYAIHRFHVPAKLDDRAAASHIPFDGYTQLLSRRFEEAIDTFLESQRRTGPTDAVSSALAAAYHDLGFQTLADQVRRSVRSVRGNQWMFRIGHPADQPLRIRPELARRTSPSQPFPIVAERTPVRMDLTHSAWSDIFFLGMDFPQGARVLNVSIDLAVWGRDKAPKPPVEAYLRVIDEPVLRLVSVDLAARADVTGLPEVFDFARDYLGLLKAAVIASGIVPPGVEGSGRSLADILSRVVGPGLGLEIVSSVNNIPKGSRLAVSTNLLGALISVCMRATGQAKSLTGTLQEHERRLVAARAILGEWLGGSGGGWQDSGGVWPGIKLIQGAPAAQGDPELGVSRGRLLPTHKILDEREAPQSVRTQLQESLVLVHGGMAQNVGPILEMVTEKYLLRSEAEWAGRKQAIGILDEILAGLRENNVRRIGQATMRNFFGPIQTIIPWASTHYTELLIERTRKRFGDDFWGFWMLGGMSGGGMGFIFSPRQKPAAQQFLKDVMSQTKLELQNALPFAMEPVVYDFAINPHGTHAELLTGNAALLPPSYYALMAPQWLRTDPRELSPLRRGELDRFGAACRTHPELSGMVEILFDRLLPRSRSDGDGAQNLADLLESSGFDREQHEQVRADLRSGRTGLAQNRLPPSITITDVKDEDVADLTSGRTRDPRWTKLGGDALASGQVAVLSLAAGAGSRWTQGAGVVKALHPFCKLAGRHRTFLEVHLAKSRRASRESGAPVPHLIATSYLTHGAIEEFLRSRDFYGYGEYLHLSPGRSVGLRMVPMVRDLRFAWEELPQRMLDEQAQKVREGLHAALIGWAEKVGEGSDYTDNVPSQCVHPVGHWFEVPNLFRNGVLARLLEQRPSLKYLMLHNIDTVGADLDATALGLHIERGSALTFEVIRRRIDDRGGGLARVDGRPRLVEGLAMPREEDEFDLSYYNTLTTWIDLDRLLAGFGLTRPNLTDEAKVSAAVRTMATRMPTYITLKDVKKRWGHGQEDVFPVAQFEKLWGDMTALPDLTSAYAVVPRARGQQLKDQAQLDGWLRDGSAAYVETLCEWG